MKDGTEETTVMEVIFCRAFNKQMVADTCEKCDFYGGLHKVPVKGRNEAGDMVVLRHDRYQICKKPTRIKIDSVGALKGDS